MRERETLGCFFSSVVILFTKTGIAASICSHDVGKNNSPEEIVHLFE